MLVLPSAPIRRILVQPARFVCLSYVHFAVQVLKYKSGCVLQIPLDKTPAAAGRSAGSKLPAKSPHMSLQDILDDSEDESSQDSHNAMYALAKARLRHINAVEDE